jgi:hypothetical protein
VTKPITFAAPGDFEAYNAALHFLRDHGYYIAGNRIVCAGTACGTLEGDFRHGPVVVRMREGGAL